MCRFLRLQCLLRCSSFCDFLSMHDRQHMLSDAACGVIQFNVSSVRAYILETSLLRASLIGSCTFSAFEIHNGTTKQARESAVSLPVVFKRSGILNIMTILLAPSDKEVWKQFIVILDLVERFKSSLTIHKYIYRLACYFPVKIRKEGCKRDLNLGLCSIQGCSDHSSCSATKIINKYYFI